MILIRKILFVSSFFFFALQGKTQTDFSQFSHSRLTQDDGLSQGSNYFRYEDTKGFMWITCNDAINRYDGNMVKVYNLDRYFRNCPNLQQGYGFAEDDGANLYIGSVRGLYIYHRDADKFTLQKIYALADETAMPFAFKNGKIYCFNKQYQIATYDVTTKRVEQVGSMSLPPLLSIHIYDLADNLFYHRWPFIDNNNAIWCIGKNKVMRMDCTTKETHDAAIAQTQPLEFFSCFFDSVTNNLLIGGSNGLIAYNTITRKQRNIETINGMALGRIEVVCSNNTGIALTSNGEVIFLNKELEQPYNNWKPNLISTRLFSFGFDKAGRLWMCDDGLGQVIYRFAAPLINRVPHENGTGLELKKNGVTSFAEFANGDMLISNIYLLHHKTKLLEEINPVNNPMEEFFLRAETDTIRKGIWLSAINYPKKLVKVYFSASGKTRIPMYTISKADSLGNMQYLKVLADGRILASFSQGLCWLKNKSVVKIANQPYNNSFVINPISKMRCAISYLNNDMWQVQLTNSDTVKFVQKILPGIQSFYLQEDTARNQYWAGTNKGVYLLDKNFKPIKLFDANNGLAGTYIYGLLLDGDGNVWCSHQRGLSSIDATTFAIINYDKNDGIQDWDFNNRAYYKATDGTLYFGGVSGLNYLKPPLRPSVYYQPEVYVEEIEVNNKTFLPDTNANFIPTLKLPFTQNNIAIKAIVKDLGNANSIQLIYRIKETDIKWMYLPNKGVIAFNSLSPGTYTLQLGIYNKFLHEEKIQKTIIIVIARPFYMSAWFWVLSSILVTVLLLNVYNRRRIKNQKILFEQQMALEQQRNKITADLHDDIGASLSSLQVNSSVANQLLDKDIPQARIVLGKIENQAQNLADKMSDIIWSMKPGKDEFMTISTRIKTFANDIIGATNINYTIAIDGEIDTSIKDITTRKNIIFITKEAINNAVKYSRASQIAIKISIQKNELLLSVADNGIGFISNNNTGNGIANMRKRSEELNGIFTITASPQNGTAITVKIPLIP